MDTTDRSNSPYWRSCCAGCLVELGLLIIGVSGGYVLAGLIDPGSALAGTLGALMFPVIYLVGSIIWSFTVFILMGFDAFRVSISSTKNKKKRWLPESTSTRPGAFMFVPTGIITALLAGIILRADDRPLQYQALTISYLLLGSIFGIALWILGRNKIVGPLSPLLQLLVDSF